MTHYYHTECYSIEHYKISVTYGGIFIIEILKLFQSLCFRSKYQTLNKLENEYEKWGIPDTNHHIVL
jgi:hypothetical protein